MQASRKYQPGVGTRNFHRSTTARRITSKQCYRLRNIFHHGRFRGEPFHAMQRSQRRRPEIMSPRQTSVEAFPSTIDRPHLVKRERDIITAARVVEHVGRLISPAGASAIVGCAERDHALIVHIEKFPIKLRVERTGAAADACCTKQIWKTDDEFSPAVCSKPFNSSLCANSFARHDRRVAALMFRQKKNCACAQPAHRSRILRPQQAWRRRHRLAEENFFASSLLICNSGLSF